MACLPGAALAGMPRASTVIEELPKLRLQNVSFFLVGFLLSSLLIQLLWNALRKDFPVMPRLSYPRALVLVGLWGLLFVLVLTMISGARELMTPGAWEPNGATYRLANKGGPAPEEVSDSARRERLQRLKAALWQHARSHGGRFPASRSEPAIPDELWRLPGESGARYVYVGGGEVTTFDGVPMAYEPEVFAGDRWVLFTDGTVSQLSAAELRQALAGGKR
jgi:hypothetical protein